jgi:predicted DsbA family dithiol-disulfide isomerase
LKQRYTGRVEFGWKLSLMDSTGLPVSREQCDWFYRRSGTNRRSAFMLNSGWFEAGVKEYLAPNLVAEAARDFGVDDDRARLAIAHAALREGRKVGQWEIAAEAAAAATGLDAGKLLARAKAPEVEARARASTAEFYALQVTQRPTFLLENAIGDRAVFSGIAEAAPIAATIEVMLADAAFAASYAAHFGPVPGN